MGRPPCCDKSNVKRGLWTSEEDAKILAYVSKHGTGNWTLVPKKAGLNRCGKSCRLRWTNYLRPDLKHDGFTPEEEDLIINLHKAIGSRWSVIAQRLPGRTDNDVKNYWNTKLRKKLKEMGIDPVTHKPFSQMLSDFGSISGIPNIKNHFCNKNINTDTLMFKPDQSSSSSVLTGLQNTNSLVTKPEPKYFVRNKTMFGSSWDVSAQFHVPNLENFTTQPQFYTHEVTSSSCSSSSSSTISQLTSPQPTPPSSSSSFSWSEFLLCEPEGIELLNNSTLAENDEISGYRINGENSRNINQIGKDEASRTYDYDKEIDASSSSSAASSFVDAILSRDNEMISSQLFGFFDGSLD